MSTSNIGPFNMGPWIEPGSRYGQGGGGGNPKSAEFASDPYAFMGNMSNIPMHGMLLSGMDGDAGMPSFGGGVWNNNWMPSIAAGTQGQASGGFNTPGGGSLFSAGGSIPGGTNDLMSLFTANGTNNQNPFSPFGGGSTSSIPGGNSMFPSFPQVAGKDLEKIYGKGIGTALQQFLNSGAGFNQNVVNAEMNAAMPIQARGIENIMNAMGGHGLSSSSSAAIGVGDFETQFSSQLENMFAQQYEQSVSNYLNVLMGVKGDAKENQAQSNNWMNILAQLATAAIPIFA